MTRGAIVIVASLTPMLVAASIAAQVVMPASPVPAAAAPAPPPTKGTGLITGRVVDERGTPIGQAIVACSGFGRPAQAANRVLTDAEGRFFFSDLDAGSYTVNVSKPGWIAGAFGRRRPAGPITPLSLKDGERRSDLNVTLWRYAVISGRAVDETGDPMVDLDVRAFQQTFIAGRRHLTFVTRAKTDDRGIFRFASLTPGDYVIVAPATVVSEPAGFAGAIRAEGETPRAYYQTMTATAAAPMVFDRADVRAGSDRLVSSVIRLAGLPQADGSWRTYATTFYPSTTKQSAATVVRVQSGQERSGVDLTLQIGPTFQVSGTLQGPDGRPAPHHAVHLLAADALEAPIVDAATAVTHADGTFTFFGVPPGQYVARVVKVPWPGGDLRMGLAGGTGAIPYVTTFGRGPASGPPALPTEPLLYADLPIVVADRHQRDVAMTLRPGARMAGRAHFDGTTQPVPTAAAMQGLPIRLELAGGQQYSSLTHGQFSGDGQFVTAAMPPGRYFFRSAGPPGWVLKSAIYQGRDLLDTAVDLTADIDGIVVTFTDKPDQIAGSVQGTDGTAASEATVVLFPTDPAAWVDYGNSSRRVNSVRAAADGTFLLLVPPDGEYFLVAIPEALAGTWRDPAVLKALSGVADRIQLRSAQTAPLTLRVKRFQ